MSARFVRNLIGMVCLFVVIAPSAALAGDTGRDVESAAVFLTSVDCATSPMQGTPEQEAPALPVLEPEKIYSSANPCFVSCPNGGFIDCTWSWAGDPNYCCWKTATRCMSYNCNTGAIALSKVCLGF